MLAMRVRHAFRFFLLSLAVFSFFAGHGVAATYTWNSSAGTTTWSAATNWIGGSVPGSSDVGLFNAGSYAAQPNLTSAGTAGGLWDTGGGSVAISGSALTLKGGLLSGGSTGIELDSTAGSMTISAGLVLGAAQQWLNNSPSPSVLQVAAVNNGGFALTIAGSGTNKIAGALTGAGGLTVSGGSTTMTVAAAAAFTGATNVTAGTLNLVVNAALPDTSSVNIGSGAEILFTGTTQQGSAFPTSSAGTATSITISGLFEKGATCAS